MSVRSVVELADWTATAPTIHAITRPTQAVSNAPSTPPTCRRPGTLSSGAHRRPGRRRRLLTRAAPLVLLAAVAFVVGVLIAGGPGRAEHKLVTRYVSAWSQGDYATMYSLLDRASRRQTSEAGFRADYQA